MSEPLNTGNRPGRIPLRRRLLYAFGIYLFFLAILGAVEVITRITMHHVEPGRVRLNTTATHAGCRRKAVWNF